jgi:tight adherence protein C
LAYLLSKRALGWSAARRRRKVERELPFFLDVLTMMLESGVSLDQSFRILTQTDRGAPLIRRSLETLVADIERGMPYDQALQRWSDQLGVVGARELASLFQRNLTHGAELSGALGAFAHEFTEKRIATAREAGGRKSAQMAVVMMIFFLPALFIVLAGPAFVTLMHSLGEVSR